MTLGEKQRLFSLSVAKLVFFAYENGFQLTHGDSFRDKRATFPYSHKRSLHAQRLAIDFNLFSKDLEGRWRFRTTTEAHRVLGEFWESLTTDEAEHCWGGRFDDGNHYSIAHDGMK